MEESDEDEGDDAAADEDAQADEKTEIEGDNATATSFLQEAAPMNEVDEVIANVMVDDADAKLAKSDTDQADEGEEDQGGDEEAAEDDEGDEAGEGADEENHEDADDMDEGDMEESDEDEGDDAGEDEDAQADDEKTETEDDTATATSFLQEAAPMNEVDEVIANVMVDDADAKLAKSDTDQAEEGEEDQ